MITEYCVVEETSPEELAELVNKKITEGWRPLGGVSAYYVKRDNGEIDFYYCQSMAKEEHPINHFYPGVTL